MKGARLNPFPSSEADRHAIWEALVDRDIRAFLAEDWDMTADDFHEDGFVGHSGPADPNQWRISYPSLSSYRDAWIEQARNFGKLRLKHRDKAEFLCDATELTRIEINQDQALAHKKFDGRAETIDGPDVVLRWQTLYRLRRVEGRWKLTGFLGYLPNPMPGEMSSGDPKAVISAPAGASQHKSAGPYSPVLRVKASDWIVISGQGPINDDGIIVGQTLAEQTHLTMRNCFHQLEAAGAAPADVFRVTVYLKDLDGWNAFNEVYRTYFRPPYPARTAIQAVLWGGIQVEVDMMAIGR
jgi:enamine deaminase RidA (YjgF/YER057c/UK114 family)